MREEEKKDTHHVIIHAQGRQSLFARACERNCAGMGSGKRIQSRHNLVDEDNRKTPQEEMHGGVFSETPAFLQVAQRPRALHVNGPVPPYSTR